jgi:hypothetical protein
MDISYFWDETKRQSNLMKHGLDFIDAELVLANQFRLVVNSPRKNEARQQAFAYVFDLLAVLTVAYIEGERLRIISFRPASKIEREAYYDWLENDFYDA